VYNVQEVSYLIQHPHNVHLHQFINVSQMNFGTVLHQHLLVLLVQVKYVVANNVDLFLIKNNQD